MPSCLGVWHDSQGVGLQVETIYMGDRKISIRTTVLEEKATACNMLCCYADELKEGFYPYVEQVSHASCISLNHRSPDHHYLIPEV